MLVIWVFIHYFPVVHNALCLSPKFCMNYCCEILLGGLRAFRNNSLCKIWGANRVHYGELESREFSFSKRSSVTIVSSPCATALLQAELILHWFCRGLISQESFHSRVHMMSYRVFSLT